ncbi:transposase [candidate division KSB1 bacterium]|nr:transposase [candidate division KSB1 bacterium]
MTSPQPISKGKLPKNAQAQRGYSRDKRPDCKQICIALVVTREGIPLGYEVFDGNTRDVTTLKEILEKIESRYGQASRIWVGGSRHGESRKHEALGATAAPIHRCNTQKHAQEIRAAIALQRMKEHSPRSRGAILHLAGIWRRSFHPVSQRRTQSQRTRDDGTLMPKSGIGSGQTPEALRRGHARQSQRRRAQDRSLVGAQ